MGFRNRSFGVELEFYGPEFDRSSFGYADQFDIFEHTIGLIKWNLVHYAGVSFNNSYKNGGWCLTSEYLGHKRARGAMELSSAVLTGIKGMRQLKTAVQILNEELECVVDHRCGLHVHVDVSDLSAYEVAAIVARYVELENKIDLMIDPSRHGDKNEFCLSPKPYLGELVWKAINTNSNPKNKRYWVSRLAYDRQTKVNVSSISRHGTLEFRHHHGTLDPKRIEAWVKFCINFVEQTRKELKGNKPAKKCLPPLNNNVPEWALYGRENRYPQDISYAFASWGKSPLKGLPTKTRQVLCSA